jgi:2-polyprenyl-6-methoxyphenol hydroxylase-like FAD-dependent oxidoreductase
LESEQTEVTEGVVFAFTDSSTRFADLLFGADGIHFSVRKYIAPDVVPKYTGVVAMTCASRKAALQFSTGIDYLLLVSIHGKNGAFVIASQDVNGSEILMGPAGLFGARLCRMGRPIADKERLLSLFPVPY